MTIAPLSRRAALRTSELDELTIGKRAGIKDLPGAPDAEAPQDHWLLGLTDRGRVYGKQVGGVEVPFGYGAAAEASTPPEKRDRFDHAGRASSWRLQGAHRAVKGERRGSTSGRRDRQAPTLQRGRKARGAQDNKPRGARRPCASRHWAGFPFSVACPLTSNAPRQGNVSRTKALCRRRRSRQDGYQPMR